MSPADTNTENLADLRRIAEDAPAEQAKIIREIAQKECDTDLKAHDTIIVRSNTLLSASGVAMSLVVGLVVGLSRDKALDTGINRALLGCGLCAAIATVVLAMLSMRIRTARTKLNNANIVGRQVTETESVLSWQRDHELSLALAYLDLRMSIADRHYRRARLLAAAQWTYLVFLVLIGTLGMAIAT